MPNRKYQINASFEVIGGFWNSTTPDQIFTGTLTARQGDFTLATAPTYSKITSESFIGEIGNTTSNVLSKVDGICGFTKEGDCSLLAAVLFDSDGLRDYSTLRAVQNLRYRASTAVMGLHVDSPEAKTLDAAAFYFSKIHYLFPTPWGMQMINEGTVFTVPSRAVNVFTFRNAALEAEIICEVFAGGGTKVKKQTVIRAVPRIRIKPDTPQSVEWYANIAYRLENFFTLCLGTSVNLKRVQLFRGDKDGWLILKARQKKEKFNFQIAVRSASVKLGAALDKWLVVPEDKRPVEKMVLGMLRNSSIYVETEFLSLAQGVEGFHRLTGGPEISFADRIKETIDMLSPDFALKLVGDRDEFTRTVVQTRNFLTHLGGTAKNKVLQEGGEIFVLNQRLHALIRCVMLLQLGLAESELSEPILYQAKRWNLS